MAINFTLGLDNSRFITGAKEASDAAINTGKVIEDVFGRKLKQVISVVSIEEATRRTAEWAQEVTNTGKALGITATEVQELNMLSTKLSLPANAATEAFQNMINAQKEALQNNPQMIQQFAQLGITMEDLHKNGTELWDIMQRNIAGNSNLSMGQKFAATNILGQSLPAVQQIAQANTTGGGLANAANNPNLVSEKEVADISAGWAQLKADTMELGNALKPLAGVVISFADALVNAGHALIDLLHFGKGWTGRAGSVALGTASGLTKGVTGLIDFAGSMINHNPNLTGAWQNKMNIFTARHAWANPNVVNHGEGLGAVAPMLFTEGTAGLAGSAGKALVSGGSKLEKLTGSAVGLDKLGNGLTKAADAMTSKRPLPNAKEIGQVLKDAEKEGGNIAIHNRGMKKAGEEQRNYLREQGINPGINGMRGTAKWERGPNAGKLLTTDEEDKLQIELNKIAKETYTSAIKSTKPFITTKKLSARGLSLTAATSGSVLARRVHGTGLNEQPTIYNPFAAGFGLPSASGGGNLKIGGLFGVGSAGEKLMRINEQMEKHLSVIAEHFKHTTNSNQTAQVLNWHQRSNTPGGV